uniref:PHD-type domain-containing protein n=1 Tax=Acrobeloides nanus TaxID=290746 RepID=A0A914DTP1_9BILA
MGEVYPSIFLKLFVKTAGRCASAAYYIEVELEENFLYITRPPGKRQVKPNFEYLNALAGGVDESDEEFHGPESQWEAMKRIILARMKVEVMMKKKMNEEAYFKAGILKSSSSIHATQFLCSICLNLRESMKNDPVIQCDKCGVAVHEICYMVEDFNEVESQDSSATTEPWFCEPCLFVLAEPPFCELCPNRYGAFKRADVGGQWVHLACALYTPARTGITTQCEAAMCKNYYHITCAQKLGLLINAENNEQNYHDLPPLYLLCKKHSNSDYTRTKREAYARLVQQEENRFVTMKRHLLDGRELRKKERQKENYIKRMQSFEGSTIIWPDHDEKEKRGRLIQTSARFLESFAEKAELAGVEKNDFEKAFAWIPTEQLPIMPPAFTDEFFRFYNHRETNVIPEEETRLSDAKKKRDVVLKEQRQLEQAIKESNEKSPGKRQHADVNKLRSRKLHHLSTRPPGKRQVKPNFEYLNALAGGEDESDEEFHGPEGSVGTGILKPGSSIQATQLLCSICLNLRESMKNDPVIQCDKCGVAVHESCYMVEDFDEVESQDSSATTELCFCEPCLFGFAEPLFCELCPNRYGAFKREDVGGQ